MKSKLKIEDTDLYKYLTSEVKSSTKLFEKLIPNFELKDFKKCKHMLFQGETENIIKFLENGIDHQYRIKNKYNLEHYQVFGLTYKFDLKCYT